MKIPGTNLPIPHKSSPAQKAPVAPNSATNVAAQSQAARPASQVQTTMSLAGLLKTLRLPADKLSATILSFAKFFSLPLEPALLANARQQAARGLPGQPGNPASPAPGQRPTAPQSAAAALTQQMQQLADSREAVALATLAATDKGVKLSEKALAEYVEAIDPDRDSDRDSERGEQGDGNGQGREKQQGKDQPDSEQSPLLNTLNQLPGRDGRRWMVFPFSFSEGGAEFRASLRLLLDAASAGSAGRMGLDIVKTAPSGQSGAGSGSPGLPVAGEACQRWLFVVDAGKTQAGIGQVQVYIKPERTVSEQQNFASEVARFLEVPQERVSVRGGEFPFAPDCRDDEFMPVDEAV